MFIKLKILDIFNQIIALTEVKLKLRLRYKTTLLVSYFIPILTILMPIILMERFLDLTERVGPWTSEKIQKIRMEDWSAQQWKVTFQGS